MQMKISTLEQIAENALDAIRLASRLVLHIYRSDSFGKFATKRDNSPLTQADVLSHQILSERLRQCFDVPILSEEGKDKPDRINHDWIWLIDPLDGTKEFLSRNGEFTINVALVYKHRPVLGIIAVPDDNEIFVGMKEKGCFLFRGTKRTVLRCSTIDNLLNMRLAVSRSHLNPVLKTLLQQHQVMNFVSRGSALKYCSIAQGTVDASIRRTPLMEWDVCAADCILSTAGAILTDFEGRRLTYNRQQDPTCKGGIIASNSLLHVALLKLVQPLLLD
jgi:3'(2'), 5'-bisphosphate nucleotidase